MNNTLYLNKKEPIVYNRNYTYYRDNGGKLQKMSTGGVIGSTLTGAATGAGIGTAVEPGIGTAIGAVAGAAVGFGTGFYQHKQEQKAAAAQAKANQDAMNRQRANMDNSRIEEYGNTTGYNMYSMYAKGGEIMNKIGSGNIPNVKTDSSTKRIGQGIQVNTNKSGTDKINANVEGQPVKLDDEEIVVQYEGKPVVISQDLGEADRYRAELAKGVNPTIVANKYAMRAINLNPNPTGIGRIDGGITPMNSLNYYQPIDNTLLGNMSGGQQLPRGEGTKPSWAGRAAWNTGNFMENNGTSIASGLGYLGNAVSNTAAYSAMLKTQYPKYVANRYVPADINVNTPLYERQISNIRTGNRQLGNTILNNTANTNSALAKISSVRGREVGQMSDVYSQQAAERNRIKMANNEGINRNNMINTQSEYQSNLGEYGNTISKINTGLALTGTSLAGLDNIVNNIRKGQYQDEYLQAIAQSNGIDIQKDATTGQISEASLRQLAEILKQLQG